MPYICSNHNRALVKYDNVFICPECYPELSNRLQAKVDGTPAKSPIAEVKKAPEKALIVSSEAPVVEEKEKVQVSTLSLAERMAAMKAKSTDSTHS